MSSTRAGSGRRATANGSGATTEVIVGQVGRPHGVKGAVMVTPRTDEPDLRFAPGRELRVEDSSTTVQVATSSWHDGRLMARFEQVTDRNGAEALRGAILVAEVASDERPDDAEEFYDRQLVGLEARTTEGQVIGSVAEVVHLPAQDLLAITRPDGTEVLVPFVQALVPEVDLAAGTLLVADPGGLLDETEAEVADAP